MYRVKAPEKTATPTPCQGTAMQIGQREDVSNETSPPHPEGASANTRLRCQETRNKPDGGAMGRSKQLKRVRVARVEGQYDANIADSRRLAQNAMPCDLLPAVLKELSYE